MNLREIVLRTGGKDLTLRKLKINAELINYKFAYSATNTTRVTSVARTRSTCSAWDLAP